LEGSVQYKEEEEVEERKKKIKMDSRSDRAFGGEDEGRSIKA
jgi:hypothetical protein